MPTRIIPFVDYMEEKLRFPVYLGKAYVIRSTMATLSQCLKHFPILDCLLSYLSATDSEIILNITELLYNPGSNAYIRYIDI